MSIRVNQCRFQRIVAVAISLSFLVSSISRADDFIDFEPVASVLELPDGLTLGQCSAVDFDSQGRLYLFHRGKQPILCFDRHGKFVRS
ncbi:MAG: hypothetical protein ABGZ17_00885, partial [Planctomycetaceae bacterium]